jgi:hypothetical protein
MKKNVWAAGIVLVLFSGLSLASDAALPLTNGGTCGISGSYTNTTKDFYYVGYYWSDVPTQTFWQYNLSSLTAPGGYKVQVDSVVITSTTTAPLIGAPFTQYLYAVSNDGWTTDTLTWANKPAAGAELSSAETLPSWGAGSLFGSTSGFVAFVQQQADGDGVVSLMVEATGLPFVGPVGNSQQHKEYYGIQSSYPNYGPVLNVSYSIVKDPVDLNSDGVIDMKDLKEFVADWMWCVDPTDINCEKPWL